MKVDNNTAQPYDMLHSVGCGEELVSVDRKSHWTPDQVLYRADLP